MLADVMANSVAFSPFGMLHTIRNKYWWAIVRAIAFELSSVSRLIFVYVLVVLQVVLHVSHCVLSGTWYCHGTTRVKCF